MKIGQSSLVNQPELSAYQVTVNTSSFQYKKSCLKQRIQKDLLLQYWRKCGMDQKRIGGSCEDRLSELTIRQIDRIIDMQRIKSSVSDKKHKVEQISLKTTASAHNNVFQANFIAKINAVAIKRDIRHENNQGFDEYVNQNQNQNYQKNKKKTAPYKFMKTYKIDSLKNTKFRKHQQQDDDKSIESFEDDLDEFQKQLKENKTDNLQDRHQARDRLGKKDKKWFYGMSTFYLQSYNKWEQSPKQQLYKANYDIEGQKRLRRRHNLSVLVQGKRMQDQTCYMNHAKLEEPLSKFKINRLVTIK